MTTANQITPPAPTATALAPRLKHPRSQHQNPLNRGVNWVPPPSPNEDGYDLRVSTEGRWVIYRWKHGRYRGDQPRIEPFFKRWPPSRTDADTCAWICVDRGQGRRVKGDDNSSTTVTTDSELVGGGGLDGLQREFRELVKMVTASASEASDATAPPKVTPEQIDVLARKYNVLSGKWMIHAKSAQIDALWRRVVGTVCFGRREGRVKVSTRTREDEEDSHVIYVYVEDYTNREDVDALREVLRMQAGVYWKIGFKSDIYTTLGIYRNNQLGLRPSRYHDRDRENGKN